MPFRTAWLLEMSLTGIAGFVAKTNGQRVVDFTTMPTKRVFIWTWSGGLLLRVGPLVGFLTNENDKRV